ncbi:MAG: AsnC family transcriptional regulator [Candidatus Bathyarchaeota archaeon]|nr:MAG: AsnC family transcriptional regulator [Candidatus Bathyarchaeota archaeon]
MLDSTNAKILEGLGKYGPRNVLALAKSIGLPPTTVAFRLRKLMKDGLLQIRANLDHSKLGLMKAILFVESPARQKAKCRQVIENLDYWTYMTQCHGKYEGYYTIFAFPAVFEKQLQQYLEKAAALGVFSSYTLHRIGNLTEIGPNFHWFDFNTKSWNFQWEHWIDEVNSQAENSPLDLNEPKTYSIRGDVIDILILKELEKDGAAKFTELAKVANITPQGVRYRYNRHIIGRNLLNEYQVATLPYPLPSSDMCSFIISFKDKKTLTRFSNSLHRKPFVFTYGKAIRQLSLILHTYTPKTEFRNLIDSMNRLAEKNLIEDFLYVILDVESFKRQTISYEFFEEGRWTYNHKKKLEKLSEMAQ